MLPQLWRTDDPSGVNDPTPINADMSFVFYTGANTQANSFAVFMREVQEDFITMGDLQGQTMEDLTGLPQPSSIPDPGASKAIQFKVAWGSQTYVQLSNSLDPSSGYVYTASQGPTLAANTYYWAVCSLNDNVGRIQIYQLDSDAWTIQQPAIFDTSEIPDQFLFTRRAGRIGFLAQLQDGNSVIGPFRPNSLMFAEYRSAPLKSITPVRGAQLFVNQTADTQLFQSWDSAAGSATLTPDTTRTLSGQSTRVTIPPGSDEDGLVSNLLSQDAVTGIVDVSQVEISFAIWLDFDPSAITAYLLNDIAVPELTLPALIPNRWNQVTIRLPLRLGGINQLAIISSLDGVTFWIDKVSVKERAIQWSGRSVAEDPWDSNYAPWTDFSDLINSDTDGVIFNPRGTELQIRGQALRQDAQILSPPQVVPQYAKLGRLVWPEDQYIETVIPAPPGSYTPVTHTTGRQYQFNGSGWTAASTIIHYQWAFGDGGFANGENPLYTYANAGTYLATLTVTDQYGYTNSFTTGPISVS
jgi:hypothetical protein